MKRAELARHQTPRAGVSCELYASIPQ
jgi:hypothetical protein